MKAARSSWGANWGGRSNQPKILSLKINYLIGLSGAPEGNNLESFSASALLEELEGWTEVLRAEPEVLHRLAAFTEAATGDLSEGVDAPAYEEPSP